ncbi:peroxiredoxin [Luteolibacter pohnpeiensis]|uniref:thioredoxin-dependent peroxiredoxin n=1 Tax=Luteolibacter pohnpeiensis TaxID=454153 RepID=A0A934S5D2_9BACT|nr:peroxiredoxin [Luteolibacter pohnpeiensis]MBK1882881.1 peroxiredoxin [Luteolibacter pohnpeiensis]
MKPKVGTLAPDFTAPVAVVAGGEAESVTLSDLKGEKVVLVFYPRDNTPGCTMQACALRDGWDAIANKARIYGISGDSVQSHQKFIGKRSLPYPLIADESGEIVRNYGVWVEKSMLGKKFMGIERSTFIIDEEGKIATILEKVSPAKHYDLLLQALG